MLERELSDIKNVLDYHEIPRILYKDDVIVWNLTDSPSFGKDGNVYRIEVIEFYKGKEIIRSKQVGTWKQKHSVGFDTTDQLFRRKQEYCVRITIYINNNREVWDNVYIRFR